MRLVVPHELRHRLRHVGPLGEAAAPPRVVLGNGMVLRQVEGDELHQGLRRCVRPPVELDVLGAAGSRRRGHQRVIQVLRSRRRAALEHRCIRVLGHLRHAGGPDAASHPPGRRSLAPHEQARAGDLHLLAVQRAVRFGEALPLRRRRRGLVAPLLHAFHGEAVLRELRAPLVGTQPVAAVHQRVGGGFGQERKRARHGAGVEAMVDQVDDMHAQPAGLGDAPESFQRVVWRQVLEQRHREHQVGLAGAQRQVG